ncbi:MAG: alpha-amylase family glycosyl hydrolase, partial [Planctomycetota bacterium]
MLISPLLRQHVTFLLLVCGLTATALAQTTPPTAAPVLKTKSTKSRVPEWVSDAVFYQLFPERFRNGDSSNDPDRKSLEDPNWVPETWQLTPWTADWYSRADWERQSGPNFYENGVFNRRCGGDLQGVLDQLDYLKKLGVNCIYFNPVFYARSLHKYDGNSFHHIDPHFGPDPAGDFALIASETPDPKSWQWTAADKLFLKLIAEAHRREIRVIIDGVFNHTGRDFFAFEDIRKQGGSSPYANWYVIQAHDNPATPENELKYQCWWGVETLPEFANNEDGS